MQRLGILGFGSFGQFAAGHLSSHFDVVAADRSVPVIDAESAPSLAGVQGVELEVAAACELVVVAVPVQDMSELLHRIAPAFVPGALVVEVASVKERPARILELQLPERVSYLGLHPMFGPQSGKNGIAGLKVVLSAPGGSEKCATDEQVDCVTQFLQGLRLQVIVRDAADHDREMAYIQGLTHWIAKALREVRLPDFELATPAYRHLLKIEEILREDSPELFLTIQRENGFARPARAELMQRLLEIEQMIEAPSGPAAKF